MATQGIVSVTRRGYVLMKIVAGADGYNAQRLADRIKAKWPVYPEEVYAMALSFEFGCPECLVVMTAFKVIFEGEEDINPLYQETLQQPEFNPRWKCGIADHVVVIEV